MKYLKLKFLLMFFALAMAIPPAWAETVTDELTYETTGITGTAYVDFSGKTASSDAVYAGQCAGENNTIQIRSKNNNSGIITTQSGGKVKSIKVNFYSSTASGRKLNVYGKNTAYSSATDLYGDNAGTLIGAIEYNTANNPATLTIDGDYKFIGLRSDNGAIWMTEITIVWELPGAGSPSITIEAPTKLPFNDEGGVYTVNASFLPDNGLGVSVSDGFSRYLTNGNNDPWYFSAPYTEGTGNTVTNGQTRVNYTGREFSATGTITYASGSASETADLSYRSDVYIYNDNANGSWNFTTGNTKMDYADGVYTKTITIDNAGTCILFGRTTGESYDWNNSNNGGNRLFFGVYTENNGEEWVYGTSTSNNLNLNPADIYGHNKYSVIKLPTAGEYTITIDPTDKTFSIEKAPEPSEPVTYVKVTSSDQFMVGKKYIFVHEGAKKAMGNISGGKGTPVDIVIKSDGKIDVAENSGVIEFTLGGTAYNYTFAIPGGGYLRYGSSTNIYGDGNPDNDANSYTKWKPRAIGTTSYSVTNVGSTDRSIKANSTSIKFGCYTHNDSNSDNIAIYVEDDGETPTQTVAIPTFDPVGGNYKTPKSVTINCATQGAEIRYTTDGTDPTANSTLYDGPITVNTPNATTTIKAIGVKTDMNNSGIATAEYTLPQSVNTLAAANALAPTTGSKEFFFTGDVVVTYAGGDYIWLRDVGATTGGGLFYRTGTEVTTPGAVLSQNWGATAKQYKGLIEFTDAEGVETSGNTAAYAPFNRTGVELTDAHMNEYIVFNNVRIDSKDPEDQNGKTYHATYVGENREDITYQLYDQFGTNPEVGKIYNITGVVTKFNDIQVYPTALEEVVQQVATPTITPNGGEFTAAQEVTIATTTEGATVYYSLDGENWTEGTTLTVDHSGKVYAKATKVGMNDSEVAEATFTINYPAITVTLEPETETYTVGDDDAKVKVTVANTVGAATVTYMIGETAETANTPVTPEDGYITIPTDEAGTVVLKVTASDAYHAEPVTAIGTYTIEPKPYMMAEPTSLDFVTVIGNDPVSKTFTVMAENLKEDIALTMTESTVFTFTPATIAKADMTEEGVEVTVTYNPTAVTGDEFDKATVTIKSTDADDVKVYLTGMATLPDPELTVTPGTLEMGTDPTGTFTVTGQHLTEDVTLTVTEGTAANFVITPANITPDEEGKVNQEITVTYKGNSTEDEYATITVKSGIAKKEVIVTARVLPTPELIADPESLTMTAVVGQTPATATFTVMAEDLRGDITLTLSETDAFTINPATIAKANMTEDGVEVTVTYTPTQAGNDNATITIASEAAESVTVTLNGTATVPEVVAAPTFSLVAGTYGEAQQLTISAESGATILYSTDGSEPTTEYTGAAIDLGQGTTTVKAVATKDGFAKSPVVTATYIIDIPEELPTITPFKGYYQIKNNGNNKYANIAGRKTLNFTDAENAKKMAGTVIWLETNEKGQVQSIRSQAADLQGYANRAMRYVPQMVDIVVNKINEMEGIENATGPGSVLGETGLDSIMAKFNKCFDYHLYVEQAQGGWRLYGKTPNMQHVVDFYRDHKDQVEAKLPMLEGFINDALHKLINKIGGSTVFTDFSLHQIWKNMGGTLTEPNDDASIMAFYREVLNNKNYVWDFAYQTAQIYWNNVKDHPRYDELKAQLGEYADYIDEFVNQVRPDFKYYVIQRGNEPDYISEGNGEIINNDPRTLWTLEPRTDFTVNIAGEQFGCPYAGGVGGYATTLYTDFGYNVPDGVTAYKVASVENGVANLQALSGVIPAQTPVLLMAKTAKDYVLTLSTEAGTKVTGNLLVGVDSLITRFQLKTPMVETLFNLAQGVLGEQLYNQYVAQYEYLQLLYAGTVNNKYFWGLNSTDTEKCAYINENNEQDCVIRNLGNGEFVNDWAAPKTNKAFLLSETDQTITISTLKGDVNHDGDVNIVDVTALIDRLLGDGTHSCPYCSDVNSSNDVNIKDVTDLIDILLRNGADTHVDTPTTDPEGGDGN